MADNVSLPANTGKAATDKVTYSSDEADVQLMRPVHVTGSEGGKTVVDITTDDGQKVVLIDPQTGDPVATEEDGSLKVTAGFTTVQGNVAHDSPDSGNPLKVAGVYRATPPAVADGDRADLLIDAAGRPQVVAFGGATSAKQDTQINSLGSIDSSLLTIDQDTGNISTAVQIMDDWDESDRAKVNVIAGQTGVAAGAGAVGASTQRMTLGSDDPAVVALQIMDDWDSSDRAKIVAYDSELALGQGMTGLRDMLVAERMTVLSDSLADGIAGFWTQSTAGGGTITSTVGEGQLKTSTGTTGSAQISSTNVPYYPGQVAWMNSALRFGDTGTAGNIRRVGMFTVSGTTPQEGFYYELSGTTLNAVYVKAASATAVASGSWSEFATAPFTLDTNYHSFEIRYTANTVWFYIDNVLRHRVSGTSAALTTSLTLPITVTNVKTSGASDITFAIRNIGNGRFGTPGGVVAETGLSAVEAMAVGGGTPHDSVDSGSPLKMGYKAANALPTAVANADRVNGIADLFGRQLVTAIDPAMQTSKYFNATSAQTGIDVWDPAAGKRIAVTALIVGAYGTTAGRMILWFGDNADTSFTAGTDQVLAAASFAPSASSKPGLTLNFDPPIYCTTADRELHITTDAALSIDVTVHGFEW